MELWNHRRVELLHSYRERKNQEIWKAKLTMTFRRTQDLKIWTFKMELFFLTLPSWRIFSDEEDEFLVEIFKEIWTFRLVVKLGNLNQIFDMLKHYFFQQIHVWDSASWSSPSAKSSSFLPFRQVSHSSRGRNRDAARLHRQLPLWHSTGPCWWCGAPEVEQIAP